MSLATMLWHIHDECVRLTANDDLEKKMEKIDDLVVKYHDKLDQDERVKMKIALAEKLSEPSFGLKNIEFFVTHFVLMPVTVATLTCLLSLEVLHWGLLTGIVGALALAILVFIGNVHSYRKLMIAVLTASSEISGSLKRQSDRDLSQVFSILCGRSRE